MSNEENQMMEFIDLFLHIDQHLTQWAQALGPWLYILLFLIIFAETGLVITPFLPGDSLLFAVGALTALEGSPIQLWETVILLLIAAILGDAVNYSIGYRIGPKVFQRPSSKLLNQEHLRRAQEFYEKHGGKTIVLARFVPIIRTFAPFVAGIGKMQYRRFALFNIAGAIFWVVGFTVAGNFFGNLPAIKRNFHIVIVAIIILSVMPIVFEYIQAKRRSRTAGGV